MFSFVLAVPQIFWLIPPMPPYSRAATPTMEWDSVWTECWSISQKRIVILRLVITPPQTVYPHHRRTIATTPLLHHRPRRCLASSSNVRHHHLCPAWHVAPIVTRIPSAQRTSMSPTSSISTPISITMTSAWPMSSPIGTLRAARWVWLGSRSWAVQAGCVRSTALCGRVAIRWRRASTLGLLRFSTMARG